MSEYTSHLIELANTQIDDFGSFNILNKAHAYYLKMKDDLPWMYEILSGEGHDPDEFFSALMQRFLSFERISRDNQIMLQAQFYDLCNSYLLETVANDYDLLRLQIS